MSLRREKLQWAAQAANFTRRMSTEAPKATTRARLLRLISGEGLIGKLVTPIVAAVGAIYTFSEFQPKIQMYPTDPLKPRDPFSVQFIIKNDSFFDLSDVIASGRVIDAKTKAEGVTIRENTIKQRTRLLIPSGQSETISCDFRGAFGGLLVQDILSADIGLEIEYRYAHFRTLRHGSRFSTKADSTGAPRWFPRAYSME